VRTTGSMGRCVATWLPCRACFVSSNQNRWGGTRGYGSILKPLSWAFFAVPQSKKAGVLYPRRIWHVNAPNFDFKHLGYSDPSLFVFGVYCPCKCLLRHDFMYCPMI
jgi:hypothetical protein